MADVEIPAPALPGIAAWEGVPREGSARQPMGADAAVRCKPTGVHEAASRAGAAANIAPHQVLRRIGPKRQAALAGGPEGVAHAGATGHQGYRRGARGPETAQARPHRISWPRLLKRTFDIDIQHCPTAAPGSSRSSRRSVDRPATEQILIHQSGPASRARPVGGG